jgi:hypothetical protein
VVRRWSDALLDQFREVGDPLADGVVAALFARHEVGKVNALLHELIRDDRPQPAGLPVEVRDYLDRTIELPPWADARQIDHAQEYFARWGVHISVCLFCASLPSSYAAAKGVKVLHLTARLDTDTKRRVMETGQFLMDVMEPGGLGPDGRGLRTIQRVRLMHAAVRHLIRARAVVEPRMWRKEWGTPINQEDLAGTLLAFSYVVGEPLPRLGLEVDRDDADAYLHTWNVIGHLLGIDRTLLVDDLPEATELVTAIRRRHYAPSPEGKAMAKALVELLDDMSEDHRVARYVPTLIRHLIGEETANLIGIPRVTPHQGRLTTLAAKIAAKVLDEAQDTIEANWLLGKLAEPVGRVVLNGVFEHERGGIRAPFAIPEALKRRWELMP